MVDEDVIAHITASWTGIPVKKLAEEESGRLLKLEETMHQRIVGQDEAIHAVARAVRRARAGLKDRSGLLVPLSSWDPLEWARPRLARVLADVLFGSEDAMVRLDMSEYMEKFNVSRLVRSPSGLCGL